MEKFEYMTAVWEIAANSRRIKLFNANGEVDKIGVKYSFASGGSGDAEFLQLSDSLGAEGWELFSVITNGGVPWFVNRCFFRRKIG